MSWRDDPIISEAAPAAHDWRSDPVVGIADDFAIPQDMPTQGFEPPPQPMGHEPGGMFWGPAQQALEDQNRLAAQQGEAMRPQLEEEARIRRAMKFTQDHAGEYIVEPGSRGPSLSQDLANVPTHLQMAAGAPLLSEGYRSIGNLLEPVDWIVRKMLPDEYKNVPGASDNFRETAEAVERYAKEQKAASPISRPAVEQGTRVAGEMGAQIAAAALSGGGSLATRAALGAVGGSQSASRARQEIYDTLIQQGVPHLEARKLADQAAAAAGTTGAVTAQMFAGPARSASGLGKVVENVAEGVGAAGAQSYADRKIREAATGEQFTFKDVLKDAAFGGGASGLIGASGRAVGAALNRVSAKYKPAFDAAPTPEAKQAVVERAVEEVRQTLPEEIAPARSVPKTSGQAEAVAPPQTAGVVEVRQEVPEPLPAEQQSSSQAPPLRSTDEPSLHDTTQDTSAGNEAVPSPDYITSRERAVEEVRAEESQATRQEIRQPPAPQPSQEPSSQMARQGPVRPQSAEPQLPPPSQKTQVPSPDYTTSRGRAVEEVRQQTPEPESQPPQQAASGRPPSDQKSGLDTPAASLDQTSQIQSRSSLDLTTKYPLPPMRERAPAQYSAEELRGAMPKAPQEAGPFQVKAYRGEPPSGTTVGKGGDKFYSADPKEAATYGAVKEESLTFNNPLRAANWINAKAKLGLPKDTSMQGIFDAARQAGHDGIIWKHHGKEEYVKLAPTEELPDASTSDIAGDPAGAGDGPGIKGTENARQVLEAAIEGDAVPPAKARLTADAGGEPPRTTSARKADMTRDRATMGLDELDSPSRRSWETAMNDAKARGLPDNAMRLAGEINEKPRALDDTETAGLVIRATTLKNEHAALMEDVGEATDPTDIKILSAEATRVEQEFDQLSTALRRSGTEKGRALAAQKLTLDQDYQLVSVLNRAKSAKGDALKPHERAKFEEMTKQLEASNKRVGELETQMREQMAKQAMKRSTAQKYATMSIELKNTELRSLYGKAMELIKAGCH